jgi:hypothetical protein
MKCEFGVWVEWYWWGTPKCSEIKSLSLSHDWSHVPYIRYSSKLLCEMEDSSQWVEVISYARYMCHVAVNIYSPHYNMSLLFQHSGCYTVCVFFVVNHKGMEGFSFCSMATWKLYAKEPHSAVHGPYCNVVCASETQNYTDDTSVKSRDVLTLWQIWLPCHLPSRLQNIMRVYLS